MGSYLGAEWRAMHVFQTYFWGAKFPMEAGILTKHDSYLFLLIEFSMIDDTKHIFTRNGRSDVPDVAMCPGWKPLYKSNALILLLMIIFCTEIIFFTFNSFSSLNLFLGISHLVVHSWCSKKL